MWEWAGDRQGQSGGGGRTREDGGGLYKPKERAGN